MNKDAFKILVTALEALEFAAVAYAGIQKAHAAVKQMVAEGRDPTDAEWEALLSEIQANSDIIQGS